MDLNNLAYFVKKKKKSLLYYEEIGNARCPYNLLHITKLKLH